MCLIQLRSSDIELKNYRCIIGKVQKRKSMRIAPVQLKQTKENGIGLVAELC